MHVMHNVLIAFRSQDHLSHALGKFASRLTGLDKNAGNVQKSLDRIGKQTKLIDQVSAKAHANEAARIRQMADLRGRTFNKIESMRSSHDRRMQALDARAEREFNRRMERYSQARRAYDQSLDPQTLAAMRRGGSNNIPANLNNLEGARALAHGDLIDAVKRQQALLRPEMAKLQDKYAKTAKSKNIETAAREYAESLANFRAQNKDIIGLDRDVQSKARDVQRLDKAIKAHGDVNSAKNAMDAAYDQYGNLRSAAEARQQQDLRKTGQAYADNRREIVQTAEAEKKRADAAIRAAQRQKVLMERYHAANTKYAAAQTRMGRGIGMMGAGLGFSFLGGMWYHKVRGAGERVTEATRERLRMDQQINSLIVDKRAAALTRMLVDQQTNLPGVSYEIAARNAVLLHSVLGGTEGMFGDKFNNKNGWQADTRTLGEVNKFSALMGANYNMSERDRESLIRAAELRSKSNTFINGKYGHLSHAQRNESFRKNLNLINRAYIATGGTMNAGSVSSMMNQMKSSKFNLSDDAFLDLLFMGQELGGGRAGNALNMLMQNMLYGKQSAAKIQAMAKLGLINTKAKSVTRNKQGQINGYGPDALVGAEMLASSPLTWIEQILIPKLKSDEWVKKFGTLGVGKMLSDIAGRVTSQDLLMQGIMQLDRVKVARERAKEIRSISQEYDKSLSSFNMQARQTATNVELLRQAVGGRLLPILSTWMRHLNPIIKGTEKFVRLHPRLADIALQAGIITGAVALIGGPLIMFIGALRTLVALPGFLAAVKGMRVAEAAMKGGGATRAVVPALNLLGAGAGAAAAAKTGSMLVPAANLASKGASVTASLGAGVGAFLAAGNSPIVKGVVKGFKVAAPAAAKAFGIASVAYMLPDAYNLGKSLGDKLVQGIKDNGGPDLTDIPWLQQLMMPWADNVLPASTHNNPVLAGLEPHRVAKPGTEQLSAGPHQNNTFHITFQGGEQGKKQAEEFMTYVNRQLSRLQRSGATKTAASNFPAALPFLNAH